MKIVFIPDWRNNPYQQSLASALSDLNNTLDFGLSYEKLSILKTAFKYWKLDVLHIHWPEPYMFPFFHKQFERLQTYFISVSFLIQICILKVIGVKIVWTVHNLIKHDSRYKKWELFVYRILSRLSGKIIVHSLYAEQLVLEYYRIPKPSKISVIPHAHYIDNYENTISQKEAREKLGYRPEDKVFLFLGAVRPYKGIVNLIQSYKKNEQSNIHLIIAGECLSDSFRNQICDLSKECRNIKLHLRRIDDNEIQNFMNAVNYVVLPFENILTSGSLMLAMSFSKMVIVPGIGFIPEFLGDTRNVLYSPSSDDGLAEAMQQALHLNDRSIGIDNFEKIQHLSWENIAFQTLDVYMQA